MNTKKLYILVSDGGDGSYSPQFTFNEELIGKMQQAFDDERMHFENGIGVDGDGFHYTVLTVPEECTMASLGVRYPISDAYADQFFVGD